MQAKLQISIQRDSSTTQSLDVTLKKKQTGWESSKISHDTYIGTVQGDGCVWHIFYEKITKPLKQAQPDKTFAMFTNPRNNERMTQI